MLRVMSCSEMSHKSAARRQYVHLVTASTGTRKSGNFRMWTQLTQRVNQRIKLVIFLLDPLAQGGEQPLELSDEARGISLNGAR